MNGALIAARLVLAATFLLAGVAKLSDLRGSRQAAADLGVPGPVAGVTGTLLPMVELGSGVALIPGSSARGGAIAGLVLLVAFILTIAANLAQGRRPDCHCFGQVHSSPIGGRTLVRNIVLAGLATVVVIRGPGPPPFGWLSDLSTAGAVALGCGLALGVLALIQAWFSVTILRQYGRVLVRLDQLEAALQGQGVPVSIGTPPPPAKVGLPVGAPAPGFSLPDVEGNEVKLDSLISVGRPVLLIFSDPSCGPCRTLMPEVVRWQSEHAAELTIAVLTREKGKKGRPRELQGLDTVLMQPNLEVAEAYQTLATPSAVIVRPDGRIGSRVAGGSEAIAELIQRTLSKEPEPETSVQELRQFTLPDLSSNPVTLADRRGREVVLVFWSTSCGFCDQMLPDLKAWEAERPDGAPEVILVSNGAVEDNRRMGLTSTVVIDEGFSVAQAFGAGGTPAAVLVDADGKVASEVAMGAPDVFLMLGQRAPQPAQP
jgi:thiol-disulfide isomerase/thioredoxin/uncharacterized membrane protein YphA (DoxX/SURF4 family)